MSATNEAKKVLRAELVKLGEPYASLKLSAKSVSFSDLARGVGIFVTIWDYPGNTTGDTLALTGKPSTFEALRAVAKANHFIIELSRSKAVS